MPLSSRNPMMEEPEKSTSEQISRFGTKEQARDYEESVRRRNEALRDYDERLLNYERRLYAVEVGMKSFQDDLGAMAQELQKFAAKQDATLHFIGEKLDVVAREQIREAGRREGADTAAERAARIAAERSAWAKVMIPAMIPIVVTVLTMAAMQWGGEHFAGVIP